MKKFLLVLIGIFTICSTFANASFKMPSNVKLQKTKVMLVGASAGGAYGDNMKAIKDQLSSNPKLNPVFDTGKGSIEAAKFLMLIPEYLEQGANLSDMPHLMNMQGDVKRYFMSKEAFSENITDYGSTFYEVVHCFSLKSNDIGNCGKLPSGSTVVVGGDGSGTSFTIDRFAELDPEHFGKSINTLKIGFTSGISRLCDEQIDAVFYVSYPNTKKIMDTINNSSCKNDIVLHEVDNSKLGSEKMGYVPFQIKSGTYDNMSGWGDTDTIGIQAFVVGPKAFSDEHGEEMETTIRSAVSNSASRFTDSFYDR